MKRLSIGVRLTLWYVAIFALAQIVFGAGMWLSLRHHLLAMVDSALQDEVEDLRAFFDAQKPNASVAALQEETAEQYVIDHSGEFLEVEDENGNHIYRSELLRQNPLTDQVQFDDKPVYSDRVVAGKTLRFVTCRIHVRDWTFRVRLGAPMRQVQDTLAAFRRYLLMLAPLALALGAAGGYWLSRRALAPVDQLTRTARTIGGSNLSSRLKKLQTGDELQRLSDTLNEMLGRIETAFRRITEFTADASHELRTPVSLIRTEAELALRRSRGNREYRISLEHILNESERTTRLLEQLLSLARADAGRESLEMENIDLRRVVQEAADAWSGVAQTQSRRFLTAISPLPILVDGDESALRRVIDVLLDNAMKYTHASGTINLSLARRENLATIRVGDDGMGIPEGELNRIFERFYRVDQARSRSQGGAGLGLAIALWIVQQHGGEIRVASKLQQGSVFEVQLPLSQPEDASSMLHVAPSAAESIPE